jgi:tetrahydromethanopterin S-methyltransferase subunit G
MKSGMTDGLDSLPERIDRIEQKLDAVDKRFDEVTAEVTAALIEQRQYIEFAFDQLRGETLGRLDQLRGETLGRFDRLERKIDQIIMQTTPRRSPRTKKH